MTNVKIGDVAFHRNGVAGEGFHVVSFKQGRKAFLGVVFDEPQGDDTGGIRCAVLDPLHPEEKWRGDMFYPELRRAIHAYEEYAPIR